MLKNAILLIVTAAAMITGMSSNIQNRESFLSQEYSALDASLKR